LQKGYNKSYDYLEKGKTNGQEKAFDHAKSETGTNGDMPLY
jgi:hypothetical protein